MRINISRDEAMCCTYNNEKNDYTYYYSYYTCKSLLWKWRRKSVETIMTGDNDCDEANKELPTSPTPTKSFLIKRMPLLRIMVKITILLQLMMIMLDDDYYYYSDIGGATSTHSSSSSSSNLSSSILPIIPIPSCQAFQFRNHIQRNAFVPISSIITTSTSISPFNNVNNNNNLNTLSISSFYYHCHTNTGSSSSSCLYMGKGDGKKKRKKKSALSSTNTSSSQTPEPAPMRVTNDSLVPVRRQIRWAQMKKEAMRNSGTSFRQTNVKRTKYRKSLDEEEIEEARLERQKRGQDVDWDVILNATASTPLVIVDGYNIIHKYPRLKKWMKKGMLSKARSLLIHDMEELCALKGWRIEIVFDGYGRRDNVNSGPLGDDAGSQMTRERISKSDQEATKKVTSNGVRVVFSGAGMSADNYIESRCFEAKKVTDGKISGSLIIATDDNLIRSAGVSSGAVSMSADRLIDELRALRKATMYRVEAAVAKANGHAIRPPQLMGKAMPSKLTRGAIIIEDKRNRPKKKKKVEGEQSRTLEDLKKGTTSLPSWAIVPPKDTKR